MRTVADIVVANPAAAEVFERLGIDYCCGGQRQFAEACADAGVAPTDVEAELAAIGTAAPAVAYDDVGGLIGHIVSSHHRYLRRELPRLADLMAKVQQAHGTAHPEVHRVAATLSELTAELLPHLVKEEKVLFPLAIELLGAIAPTSFHCGSVLNPIRVMSHEHDRTGELLAALRHQTNGFLAAPDACPTWLALYQGLDVLEADVHAHVHLENNVLFPRIAALEADLG